METHIRVLFGLPSVCLTFKNQQFHLKSRLSASLKISEEPARLSQPLLSEAETLWSFQTGLYYSFAMVPFSLKITGHGCRCWLWPSPESAASIFHGYCVWQLSPSLSQPRGRGLLGRSVPPSTRGTSLPRTDWPRYAKGWPSCLKREELVAGFIQSPPSYQAAAQLQPNSNPGSASSALLGFPHLLSWVCSSNRASTPKFPDLVQFPAPCTNLSFHPWIRETPEVCLNS